MYYKTTLEKTAAGLFTGMGNRLSAMSPGKFRGITTGISAGFGAIPGLMNLSRSSQIEDPEERKKAKMRSLAMIGTGAIGGGVLGNMAGNRMHKMISKQFPAGTLSRQYNAVSGSKGNINTYSNPSIQKAVSEVRNPGITLSNNGSRPMVSNSPTGAAPKGIVKNYTNPYESRPFTTANIAPKRSFSDTLKNIFKRKQTTSTPTPETDGWRIIGKKVN